MRKRKIIIAAVLVILGVGLAVFLLTRDTGPPVEVYGNFSAKDIAQIKKAVRKELWKEAFPNFSWGTITSLPLAVRKALTYHVTAIQLMQESFLDGVQLSRANMVQVPAVASLSRKGSSNSQSGFQNIFVLTNGPNGWVCCPSVTAGWTSYSPLTQ